VYKNKQIFLHKILYISYKWVPMFSYLGDTRQVKRYPAAVCNNL